MSNLQSEIIERIKTGISSGQPILGVLFHGTGEPITGPLKTGGDGLFWVSDHPAIAQQYIPAAGSNLYWSSPSMYDLDRRVVPNLNDSNYKLARLITSLDAVFVERDAYGMAQSWSLPPEWPTYGQVQDFVIGELGYDVKDGAWLKCEFENGEEVIRPNSWSKPGKVYMTLFDELNLLDLRKGDEGDLSSPDHLLFSAFELAEENGYDGVIINDFAQTDNYGNLGHIAWGLTEKTIRKMEWIAMPAKRFVIEGLDVPNVTPDIKEWLDDMIAEQALSFR